MKAINLYTTILYIVSCIFVISYFNKCEEFYSEFNTEAEILNDRIDRILYVKVLQEGDTLWFISDDLRDTSWIVNDTSWITEEDAELKWDSWKWERDKELSTTLRIEYGLEFTDTFSNDRYLTGNEGLYLMGDVVIYADQYSGNTYVINAEGDTIFKYIKREKE